MIRKNVDNYLKKKKDREKNIKIFKGAFSAISYVALVVCIVQIFIYRITNPNLTETEIMLYSFTRYWWIGLSCVISTLINNK